MQLVQTSAFGLQEGISFANTWESGVAGRDAPFCKNGGPPIESSNLSSPTGKTINAKKGLK